MADQTDVQNALAALIAGALYPNGTGQAPAVAATGVRIYPGWPMAGQLDTDLRANTCHVSAVPRGSAERNTTRYLREWVPFNIPTRTIVATVAGTVVTLSGTITTPQNVALIVNGRAYVHAVQPGDTLTTVATGLATLVNADTSATSSGPTISIPGGWQIEPRVGAKGQQARYLRHTSKQFQITVWAPTPTLRSAIGKIVDPLLATPAYIALADGTNGLLHYEMTYDHEGPQKELLYRRDIVYSVDWPLLEFADAFEVIVIEPGIQGAQTDPLDAPVRTFEVGTRATYPSET